MKLIQRGAEAELYKTTFLEFPAVLKKRVVKTYRDSALDASLRLQRTRKEYKLLVDAKRVGVKTPIVFEVHPKDGVLTMEFLDGPKVKDLPEDKIVSLCEEIGGDIAQLHNSGLIHGDLTTSNMLWVKNRVGFIDFGLGKSSTSDEDRAVDLLNLKKTMSSTHFKIFDKAWNGIIKGYLGSKGSKTAVSKVLEVEKRARYL